MPLLFEWLLLFDDEADDEDDDEVDIKPFGMPPFGPEDGLADADSMALNSLFFIKYFSNLASMCLP